MAEEGSLNISARTLDLSNPADAENVLGRPGVYACLSIRNNGRGIPEDIRDRLLDPFFSTKEMGRRVVGVGLSSTYGFINPCGGTIQVESEPNQGTAIQVYLPANRRFAELTHKF